MSRINTNISSIQAIHRLASNQNDLSLRLERLSSGLRINRGRDDPAGLIASESLRSEISGLNQAIENSSRAINVIATAEGALTEVSALLLNIRSLITKSANEGALSPQEIEANQLEVDSILASIDRISNTTQFNGVKLLNGTLDYTLSTPVNFASSINDVRVYSANVPEGYSQPVTVQVVASAKVAAFTWGQSSLTSNATIQVTGNNGSQVFSFVSGMSAGAMASIINNSKDLTGVSATVNGSGTALVLNSQEYGSNAFVSVHKIYDGTGTFTDTTEKGTDADVRVNGIKATTDGLHATVRAGGLDMELALTETFGTQTATSVAFGIEGGGALFQLGPDVVPNGQYRMGIQSIATGQLGNTQVGRLSELGRDGSYSLVGGNYQQAQKIVAVAVQQVATLRGRLGGFQKNQLETNINSQQIALENVKASESAIRDADYATETAAMTRAQILVQSTTQILAMANQQPQNVLTLLKNM
jgi:flagellin